MFKFLRANIFQTWHDNEYWSKGLYNVIPAPGDHLKVMVTDLEI